MPDGCLKLFSEERKAQRIGTALSFLECYDREGDAFLDQIVTDETWVRCVNAETKLQSMQWGHTASPKKPTKCCQTLSTRKFMATVFLDKRGLLLVEFLERIATVNTERYCNILRNFRRAIQNKHHGRLSSGVIFLHDNAGKCILQPNCERMGKYWITLPTVPIWCLVITISLPT